MKKIFIIYTLSFFIGGFILAAFEAPSETSLLEITFGIFVAYLIISIALGLGSIGIIFYHDKQQIYMKHNDEHNLPKREQGTELD